MQINRSNYEIWFIDWLDGNLSQIDIDQLHLFLGENPDLKEELEELTNFRLNPDAQSYINKNHLLKTTANLSKSQFEYMCIAYLEKDLTADQQAELMKSIKQDPEKRMSFELFQKMKLPPETVTYKDKNLLLKRTLTQKVMRLSVIGISVAAALALVYINYFLIPRTLPDKSNKTAQNIVADSTIQKPVVQSTSARMTSKNAQVPLKNQNKNLITRTQIGTIPITESSVHLSLQNDSLVRSSDLPPILLKKIPISAEIILKGETIDKTLIAINNNIITVPEYDDGRSKLSKFIARTFREKILREKVTKDSPLKGYEIAEAGVSGLNKLLGWEMALDKRNDEDGELKSVYFSSKILKFNAPVKKSEQLP